MTDDGFIPRDPHADFHWLSEGLNADERDLPNERPAFVRGYSRTARGGIRAHDTGEVINLPTRAVRLA